MSNLKLLLAVLLGSFIGVLLGQAVVFWWTRWRDRRRAR